MKILLKDLMPGDVFQYVDQTRIYRKGKFKILEQHNFYLKPSAKHGQIFILNLQTNEICNHRANLCIVLLLKAEENNVENKMGHFIQWKFGVPVNVKNVGFPNFFYENVLLISEEKLFFKILAGLGTHTYSKKECTYELIPYQQDGDGPVYPVCQAHYNTAYLDEKHKEFGGIANSRIKPVSTATLNIDGKTIELSAETTAELKNKLGI